MTAPTRAPLDRRQLALVLSLLDSPVAGEAAAAARAAAKLVRAADTSWDEILTPPQLPRPPRPTPQININTANAIIDAAGKRSACLTPWEFHFIGDLADRRPRRFSERQIDALGRIANKLGLRWRP